MCFLLDRFDNPHKVCREILWLRLLCKYALNIFAELVVVDLVWSTSQVQVRYEFGVLLR
jgi:hypothetical protein